MPITQDRMIALISAANDIFSAFKRLREVIEAAEAKERSHEYDARSILYDIFHDARMVNPSFTSAEIVATEKAHFRINASRNDIKRRQIARRRADENPYTLNAALLREYGDDAGHVKAQAPTATHSAMLAQQRRNATLAPHPLISATQGPLNYAIPPGAHIGPLPPGVTIELDPLNANIPPPPGQSLGLATARSFPPGAQPDEQAETDE